MRLTHIKLAGFKSFVDPTTLTVPGQLVAVIGPNGCGKSNVIDAVRWVLGEASAKQLRGESMQDVIFNGANTRRPAPRASVELVFNNSDGQLQGPWGQYTEVAIKRQLTRQGESTYYINNQVVRRRDITDLFLGTGVGARGYAVIEQGMISRIIEARPEELRAYIEEAAGISKYKERRRETESRLKDTREHVQRLGDLQSELDRQVEKLQRQAKTAEQYQALKAQLTQQQDLLDYVQWQQALQQADEATTRHQQHQATQTELTAQINALQAAAHAMQQQEQQQQQQVHEWGNERALLREQWARLEEQIRHRQSLQQRFEREQNQAQTHLQRLQQQTITLAEESTGLDEQLAEQQLSLEEWAWQITEHETLLPELEEQAQQAELARQSQQSEWARLQREYALKQQQQKHAEQNITQLQQRQLQLADEQKQLALPEESVVAAAQEAAALAEAEVLVLEDDLVQSEAHHADMQAAYQAAQAQLQTLEKQQLTLTAQQSALAALLPAVEADDFWAQTAHTQALSVWQQIEVDTDWQQALGVALGKRLQARCLPNFQPPEPLPPGSAQWINRNMTPSSPIADPLSAHVHAQSSPLLQAALHHWLDHIGCAETLSEAITRQSELTGQQALITPQGHWVDAVSISLFAETDGEPLLQRQQQLRQWEIESAALEVPLQQAQQALAHCMDEMALAKQQQQQQQNQLKQHQQTLQAASKRATELLTQTNQGQMRQERIRQEWAQITAALSQESQQRDAAAADAGTLQQSIATLADQQQHQQQLHQQQLQSLKQTQLSLLEARRTQGMVEMTVMRLQQRQHAIAQEQSRITQEREEWQERQSELALHHEQESLDGEWQAQLAELNAQMEAANARYDEAQSQLNAQQKQVQAIYEQQQTLSNRLPESQAATQQALLQQQEALLNAKRYHETLKNNGADLDALAQQHKDSSPQALGNDIATLAQRIAALGAVNLAALQELAEATERQHYYTAQRDDVQAAIALLEEAIAQIDHETKARFKHTFDAVNEKVQAYFPTLFGGGEAALHMVGDDLLSAGVSIMARPPGKKNSTIYLLSGGEKALTAMSLVFALFSLNPAPFCLLDEVDAPLDDANTSRFCQLVKEMSAQTQFLYISHNRLTMEMAEQLVGVTMQEKGVSRIVAVDIQQALSMAEPNRHNVIHKNCPAS
ncbi:chromosome segregation protein SMC [Snodgrassella sp. CFCC 13594]|uniref:chromosome segregation protein SMC n=1 Tax=Snodgrassella sp. CFCC 13594 TaxID=1775559 RepID=UPI0008348081|nr:chromosome segregation protein SMC [Snodgrassella sp. CFCC 13594]